MAEIYVRASRVVIWLEDPEEVVGDGKTGLDDEVVVGQSDKPEVADEDDQAVSKTSKASDKGVDALEVLAQGEATRRGETTVKTQKPTPPNLSLSQFPGEKTSPRSNFPTEHTTFHGSVLNRNWTCFLFFSSNTTLWGTFINVLRSARCLRQLLPCLGMSGVRSYWDEDHRARSDYLGSPPVRQPPDVTW